MSIKDPKVDTLIHIHILGQAPGLPLKIDTKKNLGALMKRISGKACHNVHICSASIFKITKIFFNAMVIPKCTSLLQTQQNESIL